MEGLLSRNVSHVFNHWLFCTEIKLGTMLDNFQNILKLNFVQHTVISLQDKVTETNRTRKSLVPISMMVINTDTKIRILYSIIYQRIPHHHKLKFSNHSDYLPVQPLHTSTTETAVLIFQWNLQKDNNINNNDVSFWLCITRLSTFCKTYMVTPPFPPLTSGRKKN